MAISIADQVRYLRQFVRGFDAKDGVKISGAGLSFPVSLSVRKENKILDDIEYYYREIRTVTSSPFKVVRARNNKIKDYFNDMENLLIPSKRMKVYFAKAENASDNIVKIKNGHYSKEGLFRKYYFKFDCIKAAGYGGKAYLQDLISSIPPHYELVFKFLMSLGGAEFNGSIPDLDLLINELQLLNNKYKPVYSNGKILDSKGKSSTFGSINKFVVYAYDAEFVDEETMSEHISEFMDRTKSSFGKKMKLNKKRHK